MSPISSPAYGAFILRRSLGIMFIAHALLKLLVFTLPCPARFSFSSRWDIRDFLPMGCSVPS